MEDIFEMPPPKPKISIATYNVAHEIANPNSPIIENATNSRNVLADSRRKTNLTARE